MCFIIVFSDLWVINTLYQGNNLCILLCSVFYFVFTLFALFLFDFVYKLIALVTHSLSSLLLWLIIDYQILFTLFLDTWSELLVPLVNMIKEGCENKSALLIHLIFYFF